MSIDGKDKGKDVHTPWKNMADCMSSETLLQDPSFKNFSS
jgi:hypothetical protein